jgi:hypothetical protein
MPLPGILASQMTGHLSGPVGAYDALASVTLSAATASVTFAGIPSGYKHLQIRAMHLYTGTGSNMAVTYNGGTFANSYSHFLYGNGSSATSSNDTTGPIISFQSGTTSTSFCVAIYDLLDYASTNKNKTLRGLVGQDVNGSGIVGLISALGVNTSAINSLTFTYTNAANFVTNTSFALYGVK